MTPPRRILVAGSCGFMGRHVVRVARELWPDAALFGLGRTEKHTHLLDAYLPVEVGAENAEALREYVAANRPEAVVNCMGALSTDYATAMRANVDATQALVRAVSGVTRGVRLVHLGSASEYAPLGFPAKTDESSPARPISAYGKTKLLATRLVLEADEEGTVSGVVLRLSNPLGPRMNPATLPGTVLERLGDPWEDRLSLGDLSSYRDFVDAREAARAVALALETSGVAGGRLINIGSGNARTARDLVRGLLRASGRDLVLQEDAGGSSRSQAVSWQAMDVARARAVLGWEASIPWEQTLRYMVSEGA